jgi:DNA polymerase
MPGRLTIDPGYSSPQLDAWRNTARELLLAGIPPDEIDLADATTPQPLALGFATEPDLTPRAEAPRPSVPRAFLELAGTAACHADPHRWNLLYRILWRLQRDRELLHRELDPDIAELRRLDSQVRRDLHKMHAFLRFRMVPALADSGDDDHYIAWYRPDHRILELAVPFFAERFAPMRWTILTSYAAASHDPATKQVTWGPGVPRSAAPEADELESLWRSYYASIFNPARLNPRAMKAEMPTRYWKQLPELELLPQLMTTATTRVDTMMEQQKLISETTAGAGQFVPAEHTLPALAGALPHCQGCELYKHATQAVFGMVGTSAAARARPGAARLMLVGEQPGDEEDRRGEPFVGPAGKVLDRALDELGLDRRELYITNAVKHFKFTLRGKRRIHESPRLSEVTACRPWLLAEIDALRPQVVVCLGATAAKSLLGAKFALMKDRGKLVSSPYAEQVIATLHPSAILRAFYDDSSK